MALRAEVTNLSDAIPLLQQQINDLQAEDDAVRQEISDGDAATLDAAQSYTDGETSALSADISAGDAAALAEATAYVDAGLGALSATLAADHYTAAEVDSLLAGYVSLAHLTANYYDSVSVDALFDDYAHFQGRSEIDALGFSTYRLELFTGTAVNTFYPINLHTPGCTYVRISLEMNNQEAERINVKLAAYSLGDPLDSSLTLGEDLAIANTGAYALEDRIVPTHGKDTIAVALEPLTGAPLADSSTYFRFYQSGCIE